MPPSTEPAPELRTRRYRIRPGDMKRLWTGQTVSTFGDELTAVALPTIALLTLQVSSFQFGLLSASTYLPYPVLGLLVGAWVDRLPRKQVLMVADAVRGAAILSIPIAIFVGSLTFAHLLLVGMVVGTASVFFNSAYQAFLPDIVHSDAINQANARLSTSETAAQVVGPSAAGLLIRSAGVPLTMVIDAITFLVSIVSLWLIERPEPPPKRRRSSLVPEVKQGLRIVFGNPLLRGLTLTSAVSNLGRGMALQLFLLFAYNGLRMPPEQAGLVLAVGNVGAFLGALTTERVTRRWGIGATLQAGSILKGLPWLLAPLALTGNAVLISIAILLISNYFIPISNVTTLSIRQSLVSRELQGRVAATTRAVVRTTFPLAAIAGGALAEVGTRLFGNQVGLAAVLVLGGVIWTSASLLLPRALLRGIRTVDDLPAISLDADAGRPRHRHRRADKPASRPAHTRRPRRGRAGYLHWDGTVFPIDRSVPERREVTGWTASPERAVRAPRPADADGARPFPEPDLVGRPERHRRRERTPWPAPPVWAEHLEPLPGSQPRRGRAAYLRGAGTDVPQDRSAPERQRSNRRR